MPTTWGTNYVLPVIEVDIDTRNEKVGLKIREAEKAKTPYMFVVGDRESQNQQVSVRKRNGTDLGSLSMTEVLELIQQDLVLKEGPSTTLPI